MDCYATEEDFKEGKEPVQSIEIPISTAKGDTYAALLTTNLNTKANIVVSEKKLIVPINYRSIKRSEITGNVDAGYSGTLIIQRSTATGWADIGTFPTQITSQSESDVYEDIDLGRYLIDGNQKLRIQAFYEYKTDEGETKQVRSTFLNIGESITYTQLRLELITDYSQPMTAINEETGAQKPFQVEYRIFGTCDKVFKYKVYGSVGSFASQQISLANQNGASISLSVIENASSYGFLTHGVRKVEAWVEANDGLGGVIKSEVYTNHFMMVNENSEGYDATKKYLLVQNLKTEVTNFIQTTIADYAVYAPDKSDTDIHFQLTDAKGKSYTDMNRTVSANTKSSLVATIEIDAEDESSIPDNYIARLYAYRDGINFITDSGYIDTNHVSIDYFDIVVDNKNAITPITGATFKLDPKNRSNDESDYLAIYGPSGENIAEWTNPDRINAMWTTDANGIKVLRIMAGSRLVIKRNVWKQFLTNPNSSMTLNIDYRVSNVTNTTDPIVSISGGTGGRGLVLNALQGWVKTATYSDPDNCMFAWREEARQYLSLNIDNAVQPRKQNVPDVKYEPSREADSVKTLSLARILLNGDPVREIPFDSSSSSEWCDDSNAAIIIGNDGADIDIYSLTTYENRKLDLIDLLNRNYLSSIATTEEKMRIKKRNAIFDGERITLAAAEEAGFNSIIYHGKRPYFGNNSSQKAGWIEYRRYDQNGAFLPEYSGTNCKESNALGWKPQGTTAQTYWEFNPQDDNSKVEAMINVKVEDFHESIHVRIDGDKAYIYGGNLGENFPLEETEKEYAYANGYVAVPDGWIDGNGKYRGMGYQVAPDTPLAQKKVAKINYASSMQSHLIGACTTYDLLHYAVCGATPLQKQYEDAGLQRPVMAKHTEPFLMFWDESEDGNGTPYYTGLCVYGAGKMDKASWGYVKNRHEHFAMFEGADNNMPLTDFRIPFDKNIPYSSDGEGYKYGVKNTDGTVDYYQAFDFDAGKTESFDSPQYDDGWPIMDPITEKQEDGSQKLVYEAPSKAVRNRFADIHNFIYLNSTNIKHFDGTEAQFLASNTAKTDRANKYWCTTPFHADESTPLRLLRFDYLTGEWIDAGLLGSDGKYTMVDLKKDPRTATTWVANRTKSNYAEISAAFANDMAKFMKDHVEYFISAQSLRLCYQYVLAFLAGTDNSSKNTYYQIDPVPQKMGRNESFASWFSTSFGHDFDFDNVYRMYMSGDDMDSILPVDNRGNFTKPYYIERLYPYKDDIAANGSLYEGMDNQLFNFVERAYTDEDRATMMNNILTKASQLVSENDLFFELKDKKISTWGFLHKYFFNMQYYFPQVAFIEQARIRYEFAQLMGHTGRDGVWPISQSLGSSVENEQQFMNQRVVYFASFASFGEFGPRNANTSTGILDAEQQLRFGAAPLPNGGSATITFTITPHQYMYPCGFYTEANVRTPRQRTSPKQTCTVNIVSGYNGGDDTMGLLGVNYYTDLGDFGDKSITSAITISGKRLTKFLSSYKSPAIFRASNLSIAAANIQSIFVNLGKDLDYIDVSKLYKAKSITFGNMSLRGIALPQSCNLTYISLETAKSVKMQNIPNLKTLGLGTRYMSELVIGKNVGTNVSDFNLQGAVQGIYDGQSSLSKPNLTSIHIENIDLKDFPIETLMWYANIPTCEFLGKIAIKEDDPYGNPRVTWDYKNKINKVFGCVDSIKTGYHKGLLLDYKKRDFDGNKAYIKGNFYNENGNTFLFELRPGSIYENDHYLVRYFSDLPTTKMEQLTGILTVNSLSNTQTAAKIDAILSRFIDNGNRIQEVTITKTIEIWNRPAQVGDYVYADGTFSSPEQDEDEKTVVGVCCYVAPRDKDGNIISELHDPNDVMTRLMVSLDNVTASSDADSFNTWQWGAQVRDSGQTDAWNEQNALFEPSNNAGLTSSGTAIYDIADIVNLANRGDLSFTENGETKTTSYLIDEAFRDTESVDGTTNGGFKRFTAGTALGDGFGYEETVAQKNARKLVTKVGSSEDDSLRDLAGSAYQGLTSDQLVNSGYAKTLKVIKHRNNVLNNGIDQFTVDDGARQLPTGSATLGSELADLATKMSNIRAYFRDQKGYTTYFAKWSQLYWPVISACYAYEPTMKLKDGEVLADKFKRHHWFTPTEGLAARLFWYMYRSIRSVGADGKESFTVEPRENSPFALAISKGKLKRVSASSYLWSVTEGNSFYSWGVYFVNGFTSINGKLSSYVGRAVSAF